jgi:hypothetical protein
MTEFLHKNRQDFQKSEDTHICLAVLNSGLNKRKINPGIVVGKMTPAPNVGDQDKNFLCRDQPGHWNRQDFNFRIQYLNLSAFPSNLSEQRGSDGYFGLKSV